MLNENDKGSVSSTVTSTIDQKEKSLPSHITRNERAKR